eukprot:2398458-Amphidinium_carterae.3
MLSGCHVRTSQGSGLAAFRRSARLPLATCENKWSTTAPCLNSLRPCTKQTAMHLTQLETFIDKIRICRFQ